ncbi:unnamed protein product, partial [Polarella glacialis]
EQKPERRTTPRPCPGGSLLWRQQAHRAAAVSPGGVAAAKPQGLVGSCAIVGVRVRPTGQSRFRRRGRGRVAMLCSQAFWLQPA